MKTEFLLRSALVLGIALAGSLRAQTTGITLSGFTLYDAVGTPLADGRLVQLVGSVDATFSAPTAISFVGGNDVVLASFGLDSSVVPAAGSFQVLLTLDPSTFPSLVEGSQLLLRWYDIDFVSGQTAPGTTSFGQFRTDDVVDGSDTGWFLPAAGASITLIFATASNGGSQLETAGYASATTAVPEPAATALISALSVLALAWGSRRFRVDAAASRPAP